MDVARTRPWQRDTLVDVFSVGKAVAAISLLRLVERGAVELDTPVASYWPEFAAQGKAATTVRMLLSHRAGLPAVRATLTETDIYDWNVVTSRLAAETPWWEPGSTHGYHVNTFGFLVGELVRRTSGRSIGEFVADEVTAPLDADFHFGFDARHDTRTAEYSFGEESYETGDGEAQPTLDDDRAYLLGRVYMNPPGMSGLGTVNTRAWRAAQIPSANGHATARAVARIFSLLACGGAAGGVRLLDSSTIDAATEEASAGTDFVLGRPSRFGLGFQLTQPERPLGPNRRSFGHFGAGGSLGFADPDAGLAFAYTMNRSGPRWQNPRNKALVEAVYSAL
jgi:CubicO group peptidase (beta-lactamase class C family)